MNIVNEIIGYVGMAFVVSSFFMQNIRWLRILNVIGGTLCCIYGFVTNTLPTALLNLILVCINVSMPIRWVIKTERRKRKERNENKNE